MKALVFGGSGFLGSHVADALTEAGHTVTLFDRLAPLHRKEGQAVIQADILDTAAVRDALRGQEVAYNFAGVADLDEAQRQPVETARVNVLGNAILLEEARRAGLARYVYASSIYVSGSSGGFYRASKQACELYIEEYQRWFGLDYTILRYGSIYGRRADASNGVRRYLQEALEKRRITVYGTGEEMREYIHVSDVARFSVQILAEEFRNERLILSGLHPMRVRDLVEMIREIAGHDIQIEYRQIDPQAREATQTAHYRITPYNDSPRLAKKLISDRCVDMGTGLLDCIEEIRQLLETPQILRHPCP